MGNVGMAIERLAPVGMAVEAQLIRDKRSATVEAVAGTALAGRADAATRTAKLLAFAGQRATVVDTSLSNHACTNGN